MIYSLYEIEERILIDQEMSWRKKVDLNEWIHSYSERMI